MSSSGVPATAAWRKSSRCDGGNCVEVASYEAGVAIRDSTVPDTHLTVDRASWRQLLQAVRIGAL